MAAADADILALKTYLLSQWGKGSVLLESFGFTPKARAKLTSTKSVLKAAKAMLTRQARGTTSKQAKLKVTTALTAGLVLVQPDGTQVTDVLPGAVAPGGTTKPGVVSVSPQVTAASGATPTASPPTSTAVK